MTSKRTAPALRDLPELATRVGVHGSSRQTELGGMVCYNIVITIAVGEQRPSLHG